MSGLPDASNRLCRPLWLPALLSVLACTGDDGRSKGADAAPVRDESPESAASTPMPAGARSFPGTAILPDEKNPRPVILFFGNSLTAGLGVSPEQAFPGQIQPRLDSSGLRFRVVNAGVSGESSAGGLRRIDRFLDLPIEVLVLELGANDALRGQDLAATRSNLQGIIDRAVGRRPGIDVVIAGMRAPPNLGTEYGEAFASLYAELAHTNDATLIPFLLEGVGGVSALNQADGIHPTAEGHAIMAETVWRVLEPVLDRRTAGADGP